MLAIVSAVAVAAVVCRRSLAVEVLLLVRLARLVRLGVQPVAHPARLPDHSLAEVLAAVVVAC
jgi:hypothetical protein